MKRSKYVKRCLSLVLAMMVAVAGLTLVSVLADEAAAYTLRDFYQYEYVSGPGTPSPVETADGIQVTSSGNFTDAVPGVTLKTALPVDGLEVEIRYDDYTGEGAMNVADNHAFRFGLLSNPLNISFWHSDHEHTGGAGITTAMHVFDSTRIIVEGVLLDGVTNGFGAQSQYAWLNGEKGSKFTIKFAYVGETGLQITVNGSVLPGDFTAYRTIAEANDGRMYFSCSADANYATAPMMKFTLMKINGKNVSALQPGTNPPTENSSTAETATTPQSSAGEGTNPPPASQTEPGSSSEPGGAPAGAYGLKDFLLYRYEGVEGEPKPAETADGISIISRGNFWDAVPGVTLTSEKVKVDGLEVVYRFDGYSGKGDESADSDRASLRFGLIEQPYNISFWSGYEGTGENGFMVAQHVFNSGQQFFEGVLMDPQAGEHGEFVPQNQYLWIEAGAGATFTVKFAYEGSDGLAITVNGQRVPGDFSAYRAIAELNGGKMYFSTTADSNTSAAEPPSISYTLVSLNGKKVSSLQTGENPGTGDDAAFLPALVLLGICATLGAGAGLLRRRRAL